MNMEGNTEQRPNAALINREWFTAAAQILPDEDLAKVCLYAVKYVLNGEPMPAKGSSIAVVCQMIRPQLDSDILKYRERCARNAANARSQSQRVGASGSESQRVGAITTSTTTSTTTPTPSLSPVEVKPEQIEREKWLIFGYFWCSGSKAIAQETAAFWNYYESLGWKNNKGAAIVDKLACARMWHRQFETGTAPDGSQTWFAVVRSCPVPDYNVFTCYAGAERTETGADIRLRCSEDYLERLKAAVPALEKAICKAWKVQSVTFQHI